MKYINHYRSPLGEILLASNGTELTGLWFEGQKYFARGLDGAHAEKELPVFDETKNWLDVYFSGREPDFMPPLHFAGTDFQNEVWEILCSIPYGQTRTYSEIAKQLAAKRGLPQLAARAVGNAIGRNPISLLVPCHRVVGTGGSLTGYAGGIDKKVRLLTLEKADMKNLFVPKQK